MLYAISRLGSEVKTIIYLLVFIPIYARPLTGLQVQSEKGWSVEFRGVGAYSSPRAADLNGDGVKDIVLGTGKLEFQETDTAVVALDGSTGEMLWHVPARDQIFGSAAFLDINRDLVPDVLIGGRSAELLAINGRTGEIIWKFYEQHDRAKPSEKGLFNFYNPQPIPDQNGDGFRDILISNGGDVNAEPDDPDRPPGRLMVIDSRNGELLSQAVVPDGKETYMSPVVARFDEGLQHWTVIIGTGGETIGGHLYRTTLDDIMNQDLSEAVPLASSAEKGFIAPPVLCDINLDGHLDIIANAVDGRMIAVDGETNERLWETKVPNTEAYGSLAVGYFNGDSVPDFFTAYGKGVWPNLTESKQFMVDGLTGVARFRDSLGVVQTASPVVYDFNGDGFDDALMSVNFIITEKIVIRKYHNMLVVYDFHNNSTYQLTGYLPGVNLSSTPWLGDLDDDGILDIVYCSLTETRNIFAMNGFRMTRVSTGIKMHRNVKWGSYMGSGYDGVFR